MGEISNAFLEGMSEIYSTMFSKIYLSLLDEDSTFTNVYQESKNKTYKQPVELNGKVSNTVDKNEEPLETVQYTFTFTVPTKDLIDKNVSHTPQDYATLKKAIITFNDVMYNINYVQPLNNIQGVYLLHRFYCIEVPKKSGGVY